METLTFGEPFFSKSVQDLLPNYCSEQQYTGFSKWQLCRNEIGHANFKTKSIDPIEAKL